MMTRRAPILCSGPCMWDVNQGEGAVVFMDMAGDSLCSRIGGRPVGLSSLYGACCGLPLRHLMRHSRRQSDKAV
jgi:hypothetical protein